MKRYIIVWVPIFKKKKEKLHHTKYKLLPHANPKKRPKKQPYTQKL